MRDKLGLFAAVIEPDNCRLHGVGAACCAQMFAELLNIGSDGRVRDLQNFWDTAVVHLDLEHLGVRIAFWKFENVLKIRAAPGVDRLRVVAHNHHVFVI